MTNNDILDYINSKDIREYFSKIGYKFTTAESAWFIGECGRLTIKEKHDALKELMKSFPDAGISSIPSTTFHYDSPGNSLFKLLERFIETENEILDSFYNEKENAVYIRTKIWEERTTRFTKAKVLSGGSVASYDIYAYSALDTLIEKEIRRYDTIKKFEVMKSYIDDGLQIFVDFDSNGNPTELNTGYQNVPKKWRITYMFHEMWFNFPTPFKRGDIVCNVNWNGDLGFEKGPFVLDRTTYEDIRDHRPGYRGCDTTDMNAFGFFIEPDGQIYTEVTWGLMDLEYYRGEYDGIMRILPVISEGLKGEYDYELVINAYLKFRLDAYAKRAVPHRIRDDILEEFKIKQNE